MSAGGGEDSGEADLTPILDMVFQLITFFMLVCNFKAAAMDLSLKLPVLGSARPVDNKGAEELIVLNINKEGRLKAYGEDRSDIQKFIAQEAQASLLMARRSNPNLKPKDELPSQVVIRADKDTPYRLLNKVITTCQEYGYRNFSLKAMNKAAK